MAQTERVHSKSGSYIGLIPENGDGGFAVVVVASKVDAFLDSWPCNGVNWRGPIRFEYSSNGDLVDMWPSDIDGEAILALSEDAQNFGDKCCEKRRDS